MSGERCLGQGGEGRVRTLRSQVARLRSFVQVIEEALFDARKAALSVYILLSAQVERPLVLLQGDASSSTDKEEEEEEEEE